MKREESGRDNVSFKILCVDCHSEVGETDCELTAQGYHLCEPCHKDDLLLHDFNYVGSKHHY